MECIECGAQLDLAPDLEVGEILVCPDCGAEEERFIKKDKMDDQWCGHFGCMTPSTLMIRLPAAPRTTFRWHDRNLKY